MVSLAGPWGLPSRAHLAESLAVGDPPHLLLCASGRSSGPGSAGQGLVSELWTPSHQCPEERDADRLSGADFHGICVCTGGRGGSETPQLPAFEEAGRENGLPSSGPWQISITLWRDAGDYLSSSLKSKEALPSGPQIPGTYNFGMQGPHEVFKALKTSLS